MVRNHSAPHDCRLAPEIYLDYTNPWALGALLLAGTGLIMTTISMGKLVVVVEVVEVVELVGVVKMSFNDDWSGVLWKYWNTPVVRACSRELSCVLIIGTFISFATTFIIVHKPSEFTCGVMRFLIGNISHTNTLSPLTSHLSPLTWQGSATLSATPPW